ncbi:MAG: lipid-binding SYLF domain-containing protein [Planctomycetota bacterium]|jgi:lipid-binding SYLF domain-containing protein
MRELVAVGLVVLVLFAVGCASPKGATVAEKKAYVSDMEQETLAKLYAERPEMRERLKKVPGYGVFSNIGTHIFFLATGNGYGIVHDNETGAKTYMKMGQVSVGLGIGVKDFRAVFVFNDKATMDKFVTSGWAFGGEADAAAKSGDKGGEASAAGTIGAGIEVYQITETGISLHATVGGTKYWKDDELN